MTQVLGSVADSSADILGAFAPGDIHQSAAPTILPYTSATATAGVGTVTSKNIRPELITQFGKQTVPVTWTYVIL